MHNIQEHLTYAIYLYIQRGLFERHKLIFALMLTNKILVGGGATAAAAAAEPRQGVAAHICEGAPGARWLMWDLAALPCLRRCRSAPGKSSQRRWRPSYAWAPRWTSPPCARSRGSGCQVGGALAGWTGSALLKKVPEKYQEHSLLHCTPPQIPLRPPTPLIDAVWLNVVALSSLDAFRDLPDLLARSDAAWRQWYDAEAPEALAVPDFEARLSKFERMCIVRWGSLAPSRPVDAAVSCCCASAFL